MSAQTHLRIQVKFRIHKGDKSLIGLDLSSMLIEMVALSGNTRYEHGNCAR